MQQGFIHIYTGDGKGKTTTAVGLTLRAAGRGKQVVFCQFLKSDDSGERVVFKQLSSVTLMPCPQRIKFVFQMNEEEKKAAQRECGALFETAVETARRQKSDLLVFDEIFGAVSTGLLSKEEVLRFLKDKPQALEVVLTGRDPAEEFLSLADYVSEIRKVKHPYDRGCPARKGIEY